MTPLTFSRTLIEPALVELQLATGVRSNAPAHRLLLAIAIQESNLVHRYQVLANGAAGPARGWWQFEQEGVRSVLGHTRTRKPAHTICDYCHVRPSTLPAWRAIEGHDFLAVAFARLLLYSDPAPLPLNKEDVAWDYYLRCWRPGKPSRDRWTTSWAASNV